VNFDWSRSETIALAKESCTHCHGYGLRRSSKGSIDMPCNCVLRTIFKMCYSRFRYCVQSEKRISQARLDIVGGRDRRMVWGRREEEYVADFILVSRRVLTEYEHMIFRFHFLLGADWKLCCRRLKMDRGTFFHSIYRIQEKLGRTYRELQPYALFPLDEYFGGSTRMQVAMEAGTLYRFPLRRKGLWPPLKKVA
jgi:hypothetical protein